MEKIRTPRRAPFGNNPEVGAAGRATQQRILVAATEAFDEVGYARASVETITDRAGCSRPTFYQYFSGKEDLHRRLAGRMGAELADLVDQLEPVTADARGRAALLDWLTGLADVYDRHRAVAVNFTAAVRTDERMVAGAGDLSLQYRRALAKAVEPPADISVDIDALAAVVNVMAYGASAHREQVSIVSPARLAATLADLIHRTFFGLQPGVNDGRRRRTKLVFPDVEPTDDPEAEVDRRPRGLQTRQRLLDAAYSTFAVLGFEGTRVDDIAAEGGLSHGTFYRYFADKEAVFRPLLRDATTDLVALVDRLADDDLRAWVDAHYDLYAMHGGIISVWLEATTAGVGPAIIARQALAATLGRVLDGRSFGDADADAIACLSLLENLPGTVQGYGAISVDEARSATALILQRGVFGR